VLLLCTDDWLCTRHCCNTCGEAATMMCVFCPISYCDQHADGKIKTCSFTVGVNYRVRHRVCLAHKNTSFNTATAERQQSSKVKGREVLGPEDNGVTEPEIPAHVRDADGGSAAEENVGTCEVNESVTEVSVPMQKAGSDDDGDAKVVGLQEQEKLNSKPRSRRRLASTRHISDTDHQQQLQAKHAADQQQKFIADKLLKKNGIILDVVETGTESSCETAVEQNSFRIHSEKSGHAEESSELPTSAEKSPGKHCRALVVNGFHSSVSTRRRSSLQDHSQSLNISANKLETSVNASMVDTVAALLEGLSEPKDLKLVNGKELVVDGH